MSLISALFSGVSGLSGNSQALNVIGDNIANVNTVGYKGSKAAFSDILSVILNNGATNMQIGRGSKLQNVIQSFGQGAFESTGNALDMALDGSGFFIVKSGGGNFYTRAGQFRLNNNGKVQDANKDVLQGFKITTAGAASTLSDVDLAGVQSAPKASTEFTLGANLNGAASAGTTFTSPITLYNSIGSQVILNVNFTKQAGSNTWKFAALPSVGTITSGASGTLTFNSSGQLSALNGGTLANVAMSINYSSATPPAATQSLTWKLVDSAGASNGKMTGYSSASNNNSFVQDGFATGTLTGLSVDQDGIISGLFDNGQTQKLFKTGLADFLSSSGLTRKGSNLFAESAESGQPIIGSARTGGFGSVLGSTLELSNVDIANEFVLMIQTQQAFQANARVISSTNTLLSEAVNLVR